jgi:hypothetical protein
MVLPRSDEATPSSMSGAKIIQPLITRIGADQKTKKFQPQKGAKAAKKEKIGRILDFRLGKAANVFRLVSFVCCREN